MRERPIRDSWTEQVPKGSSRSRKDGWLQKQEIADRQSIPGRSDPLPILVECRPRESREGLSAQYAF